MIDLLLLFGGLVSSFGVFDVLTERNHKILVSEYIFGFHKYDVNHFELALSRAIVGWFCSKGRLSVLRIFTFSLLFSSITYFLTVFYGYVSSGPDEDFYFHFWYRFDEYLPIYAVSLVLSCFFDYWSLRIAKSIYFDRNIESPINRIVLDAGLSVAPFIVVAAISSALIFLDPEIIGDPFVILVVAYGVLLSLAVIFILKILALLFGIILRILIIVTHLNRNTVIVSDAHNYPFTFIGFVIGIVTCICRLVP